MHMEDHKDFWRLIDPAVAEGLLLSVVDLIMALSLETGAVVAVSILGEPRMVILCVSRSFTVAITAYIAKKVKKILRGLLNFQGSPCFCWCGVL